MNVGETGLNLIKGFEGLRMSAYYAPSEQWAIGYGHTESARHGMTITEHDAESLLRHDLENIEDLIRDTVCAPLNQNEFDALASLIFNIGAENFRRSSVLKKLNAGDKLGAADAFELWNKARIDGELVRLDGLVRRRAAEKSLFLMPQNAEFVVPTSDLQPADDCELTIGGASLKAIRLADYNPPEVDQSLTPQEHASRSRALFAASQAITGDPTKMIISRSEEKADFGVTFGVALAGFFALIATFLGAIVLFGRQWPTLADWIGIPRDRLDALYAGAPIWLVLLGATIVYFVLYVIIKRAVRHDLKLQRKRELGRLQAIDRP